MKSGKSFIRRLKWFDLFCIASGAMISSGIFILPSIIYSKAGNNVITVYILAGLLIFPAMLAKIELSTGIPKSGGSYFFIERSLGGLAGTIGGFACWFSLSLKSAFALLGIGIFTNLIYPDITDMQIKIIAVFFVIFFSLLNIKSTKHATNTQNCIVILLFIILLFYVIAGFINSSTLTVTIEHFPIHSILECSGIVFISFGGLTKIASIAGEIKNPSKNVPIGMFSAFISVIILYILILYVTITNVNPELLSQTMTPLSTGGFLIAGNFGKYLLAFGGLLAFISTANAGILSASRFPMAMANDNLIPSFLGKLNRSKTPYTSIFFTGLFMICSIIFLNLENLVKLASALQIILFSLIILSNIIMRESKIVNYRPNYYSKTLYPLLYIFALIFYFLFIINMGTETIFSTLIFIFISIIWYLIYINQPSKRKSALLHLIARIAAKEIKQPSLNIELRHILKDRDRKIRDIFDKYIEKANIIDINKKINSFDLYKIISVILENKLNISKKEIFNLLKKREHNFNPVIKSGIAIPHIIIPGNNIFEIIPVRSIDGIFFKRSIEPVYTTFIILGSIDKKDIHLMALSSIAEILSNPNFIRDWTRAKNIEELRDILLLTPRKRKKS